MAAFAAYVVEKFRAEHGKQMPQCVSIMQNFNYHSKIITSENIFMECARIVC